MPSYDLFREGSRSQLDELFSLPASLAPQKRLALALRNVHWLSSLHKTMRAKRPRLPVPREIRIKQRYDESLIAKLAVNLATGKPGVEDLFLKLNSIRHDIEQATSINED